MRTLSALLVTLLLCGAGHLSAQTPSLPSSEQIAATMALMKQALNPARVAIAASAELALTPIQIVSLDSLAGPFDEVIDGIMAAQSSLDDGTIAVDRAMNNPSAPIDEGAIRASFREKADRQADFAIGTLRLDRAVSQVLTAEQREKWTVVRMNGMMSVMGSIMGSGR